MGGIEEVGLEALLSLDGEVFRMDSGYWTKFEVKQMAPTPEIPHGIRYSLTLHDRSNRRILGFDNAHAIRPRARRRGGRIITWDHHHNREVVTPYQFESAVKLMEDFWKTAEDIMSH